jgi:hypothetical protein
MISNSVIHHIVAIDKGSGRGRVRVKRKNGRKIYCFGHNTTYTNTHIYYIDEKTCFKLSKDSEMDLVHERAS